MSAKKELVRYKLHCTKLIYEYLKNGDLAGLILRLQLLEKDLKNEIGGKDASLWFKFSNDDTLVTTVEDIIRDLSLPYNHKNRQLMIRNFELAVSLEGDLKVYYS